MKRIIFIFCSIIVQFFTSPIQAAEDPSPFNFHQSEMVVMSSEEWQKTGIANPKIAQALDEYHNTRPYTQSLADFIKNPDAYFTRRLEALDRLIQVLSEARDANPTADLITEQAKKGALEHLLLVPAKGSDSNQIIDMIMEQAAKKRRYISALPDMFNASCTKPEAMPQFFTQKMLTLMPYYTFEQLDPLHRSGSGMGIARARWVGSPIPNIFILLDTLETDALFRTFTHFYQIKYFYTEEERQQHRLQFKNGLAYTFNGDLFDTTSYNAAHSGENFAIFVIGEDNNFYANDHLGIAVHHSSEFAGQDIVGAGEISVSKGKIVSISNKSGHYRPPASNMLVTLGLLKEKIGSLEGITANIQMDNGPAYLYSANDFFETNGRCLPLPSDRDTLLDIAISQDFREYADDAIATWQSDSKEKNSYPLHLAAAEGKTFWIERLLNSGFSPYLKNGDGKTALELASAKGDLPSVDLLYNVTSDPEIRYKSFIEALQSGQLDAFNYYIERSHALADSDENGNTPLHVAAMAPSPQMVKTLLNALDPDLALAPNKDGETPLHLAISHGCLESVIILQNFGADVFATTAHGDTVLHLAASSGNDAIADYFLKTAPLDFFFIQNKKGAIPLHNAASGASPPIFKAFLDKTERADLQDFEGEPPIFYTLKNHYASMEIFSILAEDGALLTAKNSVGNTIFHQAVMDNSFILFLALTYHNGLLETNFRGDTPLHLAFISNKPHIAYNLLDHYSPESLLIENSEGKNIIDLANELGNQLITDKINEKLGRLSGP